MEFDILMIDSCYCIACAGLSFKGLARDLQLYQKLAQRGE